ncbi:MAG: folylpolyglutamate synthase/dihydrofolate synthase family protein [Acidobacteriaceae bacterium]
MPTYAAAVEGLYALGAELAPHRKFDLEPMRRLIAAMGHPELSFPSVLVAGTNGKGSTSATLASILTSSGYKTGLYTSPHLIKVNERIRVDGAPIEDARFAELYGKVQTIADALVESGELALKTSFFEILTAMAFQHFADIGVEVAVLEVGLGGRLDATNVVEPLISVITDVDLDHQQWLGNTIEEIAREKAGILRQNGTAVLLPQHPKVNGVIGEVAMSLNVHAANAADMLPCTAPGGGPAPSAAYEIAWLDSSIRIDSPLLGRHQWRNIALALKTAEQLKRRFGFEKITRSGVQEGVRSTRWPGRFQRVSHNGREYVVDVAHNPAGAWALRSALSQYEAESSLTLVFGAMQDKRIAEMASVLFPIAERVILTQAHSARAATCRQIAAQAAHTGGEFLLSETVNEALEMAEKVTPPSGTIVVTGSVFVVGEALATLAPESAA